MAEIGRLEEQVFDATHLKIVSKRCWVGGCPNKHGGGHSSSFFRVLQNQCHVDVIQPI